MILMPIVYVRDMGASLAFYESLGFEARDHESDVERASVGLRGLARAARGDRREVGRSLVLRPDRTTPIQVNQHE